jgi:hypothetical protein
MGDETPRWSAPKADPAPAPDRTTWAAKSAAEHWREVSNDPLGRLRFLDAKHARLDPGNLEFFKGEVGEAIRNTDAKVVLGDPHIVGLIRSLFGERGVQRLRDRAKA